MYGNYDDALKECTMFVNFSWTYFEKSINKKKCSTYTMGRIRTACFKFACAVPLAYTSIKIQVYGQRHRVSDLVYIRIYKSMGCLIVKRSLSPLKTLWLAAEGL